MPAAAYSVDAATVAAYHADAAYFAAVEAPVAHTVEAATDVVAVAFVAA